MGFLFDLPLAVTATLIVGALCLFSIIGLRVTRLFVLPRIRIHGEDSHFTVAMVHAVMVFYGLAVALIAVSVWETYDRISDVVSEEATAINMLYRDVTSYPQPYRGQLQESLRDYVQDLIHVAWPKQRRGQVPTGGIERMTRFQSILTGYEPGSEGQKIMHAEALHAYNSMIRARRLRLDAVGTHLPGVMWFVIAAGAVIALIPAFFFKVTDPRLQEILVVLLATFIGLLIFLILALDQPFRGDLGIGPEAYELVYNQIMKP